MRLNNLGSSTIVSLFPRSDCLASDRRTSCWYLSGVIASPFMIATDSSPAYPGDVPSRRLRAKNEAPRTISSNKSATIQRSVLRCGGAASISFMITRLAYGNIPFTHFQYVSVHKPTLAKDATHPSVVSADPFDQRGHPGKPSCLSTISYR